MGRLHARLNKRTASAEPEQRKLARVHNYKGTQRILCPACLEGFQGDGADERYKQHWKKRHSKLRE